MKNIDQVYGWIYKKEFLTTVRKNILPGSFVLKIWRPYHGLQEKLPLRNIPVFYFMVMEEDYPLDSIIGISDKINLKYDHGFDAVEGNIYVAGVTHPVIRIKIIEKSILMKEIQSQFVDYGFKMSMNRLSIKEKGVIKLKKNFYLEEVADGIYFDRRIPEMAYFRIPDRIEWDLFEDITRRIRVNVALGQFDAAIGCFHMGQKVEYIIRILKYKRNPENIELIRQDYITFINKPELLNINVG
jgi:hypothetical protein